MLDRTIIHMMKAINRWTSFHWKYGISWSRK